MAYASRLVLGLIFLLVNVLLFGLAVLQIHRSSKLFHDFSGYKIKLGIRLLNLGGTSLLVLFALVWEFAFNLTPKMSLSA